MLTKSKPVSRSQGSDQKICTKRIEKNLFISKFVAQIFSESLPRARKERQLAQQASAGYPLSINSLLVIRKAQRGRDRRASKKWQNPPATGRERYMPHDCKQDDFSSGPLKSREILERPALWLSTDLEMIRKI
jgi:hypothetical protein